MKKTTQKKWNQEQWKAVTVSELGKLPTVITNEWIDDILKTDKRDTFLYWGFCYLDISKNDLSTLDTKHLELLTYSSSTIFPPRSKLPKGFDPKAMIKRGQDPMLGIRELHKKGIDGRGITVATIDHGFQGQNHIEFKGSNIEKVSLFEGVKGHFHADAILSNLCGQTIGVAPKVKVIHYNTADFGEDFTTHRLLALQDILKRIKNGEEIRAVNLSGPLGYYEDNSKTAKQFNDVIEKLRKHKCEVVDSERFSKDFSCCGLKLTAVS